MLLHYLFCVISLFVTLIWVLKETPSNTGGIFTISQAVNVSLGSFLGNQKLASGYCIIKKSGSNLSLAMLLLLAAQSGLDLQVYLELVRMKDLDPA